MTSGLECSQALGGKVHGGNTRQSVIPPISLSLAAPAETLGHVRGPLLRSMAMVHPDSLVSQWCE